MLPELKKRGHKVKQMIEGGVGVVVPYDPKMVLRNLPGFVGLVVLTNDYDA